MYLRHHAYVHLPLTIATYTINSQTRQKFPKMSHHSPVWDATKFLNLQLLNDSQNIKVENTKSYFLMMVPFLATSRPVIILREAANASSDAVGDRDEIECSIFRSTCSGFNVKYLSSLQKKKRSFLS